MFLKSLSLSFCMVVLLVLEAKSSEISCTFQNTEEYGLMCEIQNVKFISGDEDKPVTIKSDREQAKKVAYLLFTDSVVEIMPKEVFQTFPNVVTLGFDNCVVDINDNKDLFNDASRVKTLLIINSNLYKLTPFAFSKLVEVEDIVLNKNKFLEIKADGFENNPNLKRIHVSDNKIESVDPKFIDKLPNLEFIDLRDNECTRYFIRKPGQDYERVSSQLFRCFRNYKERHPDEKFERRPHRNRPGDRDRDSHRYPYDRYDYF